MKIKIKLLDILILIFAINAGDKVDFLSYGIWACSVIYFLCRIGDWREKHD